MFMFPPEAARPHKVRERIPRRANPNAQVSELGQKSVNLSLRTKETRGKVTVLDILELQIELSKGDPFKVGKALAEIHDGGSYRPEYRGFAAYLKSRWKWSRQTAYNYINGASAIMNCEIRLPLRFYMTNLRPLFGLDKKKQVEAWKLATQFSDNPSTIVVKGAVRQVMGRKPKAEFWTLETARIIFRRFWRRGKEAALKGANNSQSEEFLKELPALAEHCLAEEGLVDQIEHKISPSK